MLHNALLQTAYLHFDPFPVLTTYVPLLFLCFVVTVVFLYLFMFTVSHTEYSLIPEVVIPCIRVVPILNNNTNLD